MPDADTDLRGQLLNSRYFVEGCIGRGGMGVVWRVRHVQTRQLFALKTLRGTMPQSRKVVRRLLHEARATAAVKSRHVVQVLDVEPDYVHAALPLPYIVMELLEGENLAAFLERTRTIPAAQVVWLMRQVSRALAIVHARGIVHRDLKPSNVFLALDDDGNIVVKVCDFGIAKLQGDAIVDLAETGTLATTTGLILGTPRYMAPEQLRHTAVEGPATDQWAFALIAFRTLTGHSYFENATNVAELVLAIVHDALIPPSSLSPHFPPSLDGWFERSCAREPSARFPNIEEQQAELERCLGCDAPEAIPSDELRPRPPLDDYLPAHSSTGSRSDELRDPSARQKRLTRRRSLFYLCLVASTLYALASAKVFANHLQGRLVVNAIRGPSANATRATISRTGSAPPNASVETGKVLPIEKTTTFSTEVATSKPSVSVHQERKPRRQTYGRESPQPLAPGKPCTRSNQCESGMCAAEVCQ